jgi:hypothetical protein
MTATVTTAVMGPTTAAVGAATLPSAAVTATTAVGATTLPSAATVETAAFISSKATAAAEVVSIMAADAA